uniref:hypothetical protein n=1 Tax=uncultured Sphingomonas sp. TaxID=158754 RepID=UPI0035C971B4
MEATFAAALSVLDTASAFSRLSQFAGWEGLLPLQDLALAMADLGKSNTPSMLMPRVGLGLGLGLGGNTHDKNYVEKAGCCWRRGAKGVWNGSEARRNHCCS